MFHAPPSGRVTEGPLASTETFGANGAFILPSPEPGWGLALIISDGRDSDTPEADGWEHVSVRAFSHRRDRTPTWKEMTYVKDLCWDDEDVVMQLHPRRSQYVNNHPNVLHLWRSRTQPIPEPPSLLVGIL